MQSASDRDPDFARFGVDMPIGDTLSDTVFTVSMGWQITYQSIRVAGGTAIANVMHACSNEPLSVIR